MRINCIVMGSILLGDHILRAEPPIKGGLVKQGGKIGTIRGKNEDDRRIRVDILTDMGDTDTISVTVKGKSTHLNLEHVEISHGWSVDGLEQLLNSGDLNLRPEIEVASKLPSSGMVQMRIRENKAKEYDCYYYPHAGGSEILFGTYIVERGTDPAFDPQLAGVTAGPQRACDAVVTMHYAVAKFIADYELVMN